LPNRLLHEPPCWKRTDHNAPPLTGTITLEKVSAVHKIMKLARLVRQPFYLKALLSGSAAAIEHESVLQGLNCNLIVDVGANKGQFAIAARKCLPEARIISFEPLKAPADIFEKVFEDDYLVSLHRMAIGVSEEVATMHISKREDSSSLLPISDAQVSHFPGTEEKETLEVNVSPLHKVLALKDFRYPALLKVDVQGFEMSVFKGAESLLNAFQYVYVECSFVELYTGQALAHEIIEYLGSHRFAVQGVYNTQFDENGKAIQADFLFGRIETASS
jgi:FkbM family methyltransferase